MESTTSLLTFWVAFGPTLVPLVAQSRLELPWNFLELPWNFLENC
jgi:hypothetical protein